DALLAPLRELGPALDTVAMVPPVGLAEMHMDPPDPLPYLAEGIVVGDLPASAFDDLVAVAGPGSGSSLISVELRLSGGALSRSDESHGALATFPGSFLSFAVGMAFDEQSAEKTREDLHRVIGSLEAHRAGSYLNFEEEPADSADFYGPNTYRRLREVRAAVDPDGLFRANHVIP